MTGGTQIATIRSVHIALHIFQSIILSWGRQCSIRKTILRKERGLGRVVVPGESGGLPGRGALGLILREVFTLL